MDERDGLLSGFGGVVLLAGVALIVVVAWQVSALPASTARATSSNGAVNAHWERSNGMLLPRRGSRWRVRDSEMRRQLGDPVHVVHRIRVQKDRFGAAPRIDVWFEPPTYMGTLQAKEVPRFLEPVGGS